MCNIHSRHDLWKCNAKMHSVKQPVSNCLKELKIAEVKHITKFLPTGKALRNATLISDDFHEAVVEHTDDTFRELIKQDILEKDAMDGEITLMFKAIEFKGKNDPCMAGI